MSTTRPTKATATPPVPPGRAALAAVKTRHAAKKAADLALVVSIVDWAVEHTDHDPEPLTEEELIFNPTSMALAGEGAPRVEDFALYPLAAALGRTSESASRSGGRAGRAPGRARVETPKTTDHRSRSPHQDPTRSLAASSLGRGRCSTTDERVR